jgi:hypothetical protein
MYCLLSYYPLSDGNVVEHSMRLYRQVETTGPLPLLFRTVSPVIDTLLLELHLVSFLRSFGISIQVGVSVFNVTQLFGERPSSRRMTFSRVAKHIRLTAS